MLRRPIGVKTNLLAAAALIAVASLSACGDEDATPKGADDSAALSLDDLDGRFFGSVRVDGHDLVRDTQVRIRFASSTVTADAGCNHLSGKASLDDGTLSVQNLGGTEIGCPGDLGAQDQWLTELLTAGPTLTLADDTLTLTSGDVVVELVEQDPPEAPADDPDAPTGDSDDGVVSSTD